MGSDTSYDHWKKRKDADGSDGSDGSNGCRTGRLLSCGWFFCQIYKCVTLMYLLTHHDWWLITIIWLTAYKQSIMWSNETTVSDGSDGRTEQCWHKSSYWLLATVQLQSVWVETHPASSHQTLCCLHNMLTSLHPDQQYNSVDVLITADEVWWGVMRSGSHLSSVI